MLNRWDIINHLIKKHNYKSYLEIGYYKGWSFDQVECETKVAVDPSPCKYDWEMSAEYGALITDGHNCIYKYKSDDFFNYIDQSTLPSSLRTWDIIFIDGLHEASQVERDIENSLKHLSKGGTIVLHDCNPPKYEHTTTGIDGCWTGDCYKAFIKFRAEHPEYDCFTVDTDWGVGIIRIAQKDESRCLISDLSNEELHDWNFFDKQRRTLLNLISPEEFLNKTK